MGGLHYQVAAGRIASGDSPRTIPTEPTLEEERGCVLERGGYRVHLADSSGQWKAGMLVERMYSWRGYHTERPTTAPASASRITLQATCGPHLFGTLTAGLDSKEGLLADALYPEEVDALRAMGCRLCEISKLAVDPQYGSKEVLASLFHLAYIYVHIIHKATDVLIEVNPRHAPFYQRRLGFQRIGEIRQCPRVAAPAVLLHIELSYMEAQIARHGGSCNAKERSLYPYFFSTLQAPPNSEQENSEGRMQLAA